MGNLFLTGAVTGDIIYYNGTNLVRLGIGTSKQLLQVIAGIPAWVTVPVLTKQFVTITSSFTTVSASFVDITGLTVTIPNRAGGMAQVIFVMSQANNTVTDTTYYRILDNAVEVAQVQNDQPSTTTIQDQVTMPVVTTTSGQIVKAQAKNNGGTTTVVGAASGSPASYVTSLEISA